MLSVTNKQQQENEGKEPMSIKRKLIGFNVVGVSLKERKPFMFGMTGLVHDVNIYIFWGGLISVVN